MIDKKLKICKWHQCEIGYHYHHTGEEWDQHQQFSKTDIPKFFKKNPVYDLDNNQLRLGAMPQGYSQNPCEQRNHDGIWRVVALGTTIAVWTMIIIVVFR